MSNHIALVRFPDGRLLAGRYQGTADVMAAELCPLDGDYEALGYPEAPAPADHRDAVDVIVWSSYAYGFWWAGRAIFDRMELVAGFDPWEAEITAGARVHDGVPGWVDDAWGPA